MRKSPLPTRCSEPARSFANSSTRPWIRKPRPEDLINMLIVDGEDLEQQLEDTRRDIEDLIQTQQAEKWAEDPTTSAISRKPRKRAASL